MADYRAFKEQWSVNIFVKRYEKGEINFNNPIQRGIVWNKVMSSLYIHQFQKINQQYIYVFHYF